MTLLAHKPTAMFAEAAEAPGRVAGGRLRRAPVIAELARRLRSAPPRAVVTVARGSSDNAATYARYLIETRLEVLTASAPPSVTSVYAARPDLAASLCLVISQSGRSPDLLAAAVAAATAGALVVAIVNDEASPLAAAADLVLPIAAGSETSVAATKSFLGTLAAIAELVAAWAADAPLAAGVADLPDRLAAAWDTDWSMAVPVLVGADHLYVIGRGPALGVAQEAALKFKETCGLHAEAFSAAEIRHGPMTLVGPDFPVFALVPDDAGRDGVEAAIRAFVAQGARVVMAGGAEMPGVVALATGDAHPLLRPLLQTQSLYRLVETLARQRGFDPDRPGFLSKVTQTL
jgi:glucosamine--fructose-6-phosphate aminotransferase (isomerizing)